MKILVKTKVLFVEPEQWADYKKKQVPHTQAIFESDDSFFAASVWGEEKVQLCKEAQMAGKEIYCVFTIAGKQYEKDDGRTGYINYINLKTIL